MDERYPRKPGGNSVIAHPDEIAESEIGVAKIPEILDEGFRHPVVARFEQLIGGQTSEAESAQRRDEIRSHAVITQLLEIVEERFLYPASVKPAMNSRDTPWSRSATRRCVLPTRYPALLNDLM